MIIHVFLLPALSAVLYWISSQAFSFPLAVWGCLVPLGIALFRTSPAKGFAAGWVYGFGFWLAAVWWIRIPLSTMVGLSAWTAWGWTLVFCALSALPYAVFGFLAGKFRLFERQAGVWFAAAALAVLRTWTPQVFPGSEAHNLYGWPVLLQALDLGGAPLLLFLVYLVNFQIVRALTARGSSGSPWPALAMIGLVFVLLTSYGSWRLESMDRERQAAGPKRRITVIAVQPNVPVSVTDPAVLPEDRTNDVRTALAMTREAFRRFPHADLAVWPEIPLLYSCGGEAARDLPPLAREAGRPLLVPCASPAGDAGRSYYNSVILIDPDGRAQEEYRKLLLVPFGEYLPLERELPFLRKFFPGVMPFVPGDRGVVTYAAGSAARLIPSLCYEAVFSDHTRRFVRQGGNVLVNMADDAWFGKSPASVIHLSLALFRSVEYRIPLVRVANSGVSVFVEPTGEILPGSPTPLFQKAVSAHTLYIPRKRSPYAVWGDAFLYGLTLLSVAGLAWLCLGRGFRQERRKNSCAGPAGGDR
ncbi:MAG: apolipoprotein N-acyltransferase [Smithellaceae bacterium]|nr:apolipoprotein N-acyltransferase [Syntrophaceae bacterium]MDD4240618.1 apolipoprotein N-acyltransferase [Smithellaceae bacterium]